MASAAPQINSSNGRVTVMCKMPHGLNLRIFKPVEMDEPVLNAPPRRVTRWVEDDRFQPIKLNGYIKKVKKILLPSQEAEYAITRDVPADLMNAWLEQNKDSMMVKNRLVMVAAKEESAHDMARVYEDQKCGMEPIDPDRPPIANFGRLRMDD